MQMNSVPANPYEQTTKEEEKREKLKKLQQNRFINPLDQHSMLAQGITNIKLSEDGGVSPSSATVPADMLQTNNPISKFKENPADFDYSKVDISSKLDKEGMAKPKSEMNQENIKRGIPQKYKTSSLDLPPAPDVPYIAIDEGQASPRFIRPTMYRVPANYTIHQNTKIPMGVIVQPMAELAEGEAELPKVQ